MSFLIECVSIKNLNLSHLTKLTSINTAFLHNCTSLEILILPPNITYIDMLFLKGCSNVKEINMSNLLNLGTINHSFLKDCTSLKTLILPPNIKYIYSPFLEGCVNITELNLSHLINLTNCNSLFEGNSLVFLIGNNYSTYGLKYKSSTFLVSGKKYVFQSLYHFTTHVIFNFPINIHIGIL
jgi:hypothetical protein